jgi:Pyridine nucleotide-disulphide oxidoreductase, dimerisation domain
MTSTWYSSRRVAETYSGYKVLVEEGTDRILGTHILGSEGGEVINLFALAIRSGLHATDLKHMLLAYPTSGSNYDAHALERSKRERDMKNDTDLVNSSPSLYAYEISRTERSAGCSGYG